MKNKQKFLMGASASTDETSHTIKGIANTLSQSRSGVKILKSAVSGLKGVKRPLLYSHKWDGYPIGVATFGDVTDQGLEYEAQIFSAAENQNLLMESLKNGALSVSVGFLGGVDDNGDVSDVDMLELSLTPTPADSGATAVLQAMDDSQEEDPENNPDNADVVAAINSLADGVVKALTALAEKLPQAPEDKTADDKPADDKPEDDSKTDEKVQALLSILEQKELSLHDQLLLRKITKK